MRYLLKLQQRGRFLEELASKGSPTPVLAFGWIEGKKTLKTRKPLLGPVPKLPNHQLLKRQLRRRLVLVSAH